VPSPTAQPPASAEPSPSAQPPASGQPTGRRPPGLGTAERVRAANAFREHFRNGVPRIEADKPGTLVMHAFLDEEGTEVEIVHVFPDDEAMDLHMQGAGERAKEAYEFVVPEAFAVYGKPSDRVVAMMRQMAAANGIAMHSVPRHVGGFSRLQPR
jgi:quinol monooxygenase YgiN